MRFGDYEVISFIASGSTATVYRARHAEIGRAAAIKELNPDVRSAPGVIEQLRGEARTLASFDDPHIVKVFDFVEEPDRTWLAEEWVDGATIQTLLTDNGHLTAEQSLGVLRGALLGLAYAHDRDVVHRDVSPSNIIADGEGTSMLIDFGLAAPTGIGAALGTPAYMSPEAARGEPVTKRSDVYASGAVLYTLLSGRTPFPAASAQAVLDAHMNQPAPPLVGQGDKMAALVSSSMDKNPDNRPADARAFVAALEEAADERYGAGWLERASIAGLVGAALAGGATAVGVAAAGGAGGAAATGAAAGPTVFVDTTANTGSALATGAALAGRSGRRVGKRGLFVGGALGAVGIVGLVVAVAATSSGGDPAPTKPTASDLAVGNSLSSSPASTSASPSPSPTALVDLVPSGVYRIRLTVTKTNFENEKVGPETPGVRTLWPIKFSCSGSKCSGKIKSSSGNRFTGVFNGSTFTVSRHVNYHGPCVYTSGPKKNQSVPGSLAVDSSDFTMTFTVVRRSNGPAPAQGVPLLLTGIGHGYSPRAKVLKSGPSGTCTNNTHVSRDTLTGTLTYVHR